MDKFEVRNSKFEIDNSTPIDDSKSYDLSWVDKFVREIKPYVYVREVDKLLILVPNQAHRLNDSAYYILDTLLKGHSIEEILRTIGGDIVRRRELHYFFCDLRAVVSGCLRDAEPRRTVDYVRYERDINEYPVLSEVAVTYRCNLECRFCYVGDRNYPELRTADIIKILRKIYGQARVPSVSFTGGEPLLRSDIVRLVSAARGIGLWTNMITNGTLLDASMVRSLKNAGLSSAQVSIEGPEEGIHESITGVPGSYQATINAIKLFKREEIPVHTNTTVSKMNVSHLDRFVDKVRSLGLNRFSMNLCIPCGSAANHPELWVRYSDISDLILRIKKKADEFGIKFLWYSPVPMCHFNPIAHGFGNKSCAAITGLLSIDPLGNVIPCSSWREPVGSLLRDDFSNIWNAGMLSYFKNYDYAPEKCHSCIKLDTCKGACPLYWAVVGQEELQHAIR